MNGQLLWLLLRHEFRLRQRDPKTNLWYLAQVYLVLYLLLGICIALIWVSPQHRTIQFFNPLPNVFPVVSGFIINLILLFSFVDAQKSDRKIFDNHPFIQHLCAAPVSNRMLLASYLFNTIILGALTSIGTLPLWFALAAFYSTPQFLISFPVIIILVIALRQSLLLWSTFIQQFIKINITKMIGNLFMLAIIFFIVFIASILALTKNHVLPINQAAQWFLNTAPFTKGLLTGFIFVIKALASDSFLWAPGKALLLDPISTLTFILISIGFVLLTIQTLKSSLTGMLTDPIVESKLSKILAKSIKFKSNLTFILIQREWRQNRISNFDRFKQIIAILTLSYLGVIFSCSSDPRAIFSLSLGTVYFPSFVSFANAPYFFNIENSLTLLQSAPINMRYVGWCKRLAILIPLWILLFPIIILVGVMGQPWGLVLLFVIAAPLCQVILRSWNSVLVHEIPLNNSPSKTMQIYRDLGVFLLELLSLFIWTACLSLILLGQNLWGCIALGLELFIFALAYRRNLQLGDVWGI